jgi:hypothetical protein
MFHRSEYRYLILKLLLYQIIEKYSYCLYVAINLFNITLCVTDRQFLSSLELKYVTVASYVIPVNVLPMQH